MKITYRKEDKTIEIRDNYKTQYWMVNVVAGLNVINSIVFLFVVLEEKQAEWFGFIWIILGIISAVILVYQVVKTSASERLKISEISFLKLKNMFGRKSFSLKLKNGKTRPLLEVGGKSDLMATQDLFRKIGIELR